MQQYRHLLICLLECIIHVSGIHPLLTTCLVVVTSSKRRIPLRLENRPAVFFYGCHTCNLAVRDTLPPLALHLTVHIHYSLISSQPAVPLHPFPSSSQHFPSFCVPSIPFLPFCLFSLFTLLPVTQGSEVTIPANILKFKLLIGDLYSFVGRN
jgi:hypothetical protein